MTVEALLDRLHGVRRTGDGRWISRCPGHPDRSPSLSIRELGDGRILLNDFGGCSIEQVLGARSLEFSDLYPERPLGDHAPRERRPFFPSDLFEIARQEIGVAAVIACDLHSKREIGAADFARLFVVVERLNEISQVAYGRI